MDDIGKIYDEVAAKYDALYVHKLDRNENALVSAMLRGYTDGKVVDLGCGTGLALSLDGVAPERYLGIDVSRGMLERARAKYPGATFKLADMVCVPVPDASVDSVISLFGSLSYVHKPIWVVTEINRILRPGGQFFIMAYGMGHIHKRGYCLFQRNVGRMLYTPEAIRDLFSWQFENVEARAFSFRTLPGIISPRVYRWLERVLARFLPQEASFVIITGSKKGG